MRVDCFNCSIYDRFSNTAGVPESCEGLDNIGNAEQLDCLRTVDCLSVTCNVTSLFEGYGAKMDLFPCHRPPGLEIFLISPNATTSVGEFDSSMPSRTTGVPLNNEEGEGGLTAEFQITVSWAIQQTATVKVSNEKINLILLANMVWGDGCHYRCISMTQTTECSIYSAHIISTNELYYSSLLLKSAVLYNTLLSWLRSSIVHVWVSNSAHVHCCHRQWKADVFYKQEVEKSHIYAVKSSL